MSKAYPEHLKQQALAMYIPGVIGSRHISERLGVPRSTVLRWLDPDYAERMRQQNKQRKLGYRGKCQDCGAPTSYSGRRGRLSSLRCRACHYKYIAANRKWNRESVVAAIKRWHQEHGRRPTATDWVRSGEYYPAVSCIYQSPHPIFASWSDALRAAGYTDVQTSPGPGNQLFDRQEARQLREQMSDVAIAEHYGVTPKAIYNALGPRSPRTKPRKPRTAAQQRQARIDALNRALAKTSD